VSSKTILPKICQKFAWATGAIIQAVPTRDPHEHPKSTMETSLICSILDAHFEGMRQRQTVARAYNGLANYPFHSLVFGINKLRSDKMHFCGAKKPDRQHLCNQNFNGLSRRCMSITRATDGASYGPAIFRRAARKWPDQLIEGS
jgi:hypothetical protein